MLDLKPKWYPGIPLGAAVIWHTHELTAVEVHDSYCVSDLLAPGLVKPFLCGFNFQRKGKGKKNYPVIFVCVSVI